MHGALSTKLGTHVTYNLQKVLWGKIPLACLGVEVRGVTSKSIRKPWNAWSNINQTWYTYYLQQGENTVQVIYP